MYAETVSLYINMQPSNSLKRTAPETRIKSDVAQHYSQSYFRVWLVKTMMQPHSPSIGAVDQFTVGIFISKISTKDIPYLSLSCNT